MPHDTWMRLAIDEARRGIASGQTPFGAVIVRADAIVARAHNQVWADTDPTAHAEVLALRRAALALRSIDLSGCRIYTTCEPCPMCSAAIHWAHVDEVYAGATIADAAAAGFAELSLPAADLYRLGASSVRIGTRVLPDECAGLFHEWLDRADRRAY